MDESKLLEMQKGMRDNSEELNDFLLDLDNWEKDMKAKDKQLRESESAKKQTAKPSSSQQATTSKSKKVESISLRESEESSEGMDTEEEEELAELKRKQLGNEEKEKGNKHFKKGDWTKAIECYTKGLTIDPTNALLSANRAMALLKVGKFASAESDCTTCLELDPTYVKAYLRRASARFELKKFKESQEDVKQVIKLESNNQEAKRLLKSLNQHFGKEDEEGRKEESKQTEKPKESTSGRPLIKEIESTSVKGKGKVRFEEKAPFSSVDPSSLVSPIEKPPHLRSKEPLRRVPIEIEKEESPLPLDAAWIPAARKSKTPVKDTTNTITRDIVAPSSPNQNKDSSPESQSRPSECPSASTSVPGRPHSFLEFQRSWGKVYAVTNVAFKYLTQLPPDCYVRLFGDLLESELLSQMLHVLSRGGVADEAVVTLRALTTVSRFSMLTLFMSSEDKKAVERILDSFKSTGGQIDDIHKAYLSPL